MKKEWNAPTILDLTIQATAYGKRPGGKEPYGNNFGGPHTSNNKWDNNLCSCQGGMSPCEFHKEYHFDSDTLS